MNAFFLYLVIGVIYLSLDLLFVGILAQKWIQRLVGSHLAAQPNWLAAGLFYVVYALGILVFVVQPALAKKSLSYAVSHGALLGLVAYGTYELVNASLLKDWPWELVIGDIIWGVVITASVSGIAYTLASS